MRSRFCSCSNLEADNMNIIYCNGFSERRRAALKLSFADAVAALRNVDEARLEAAQNVQFILVPFFCIGTLLIFGRNAD